MNTGYVIGLLRAVACLSGLLLFPVAQASDIVRLPGKLVWAELVTDDVAGAQRFYEGLLGWEFSVEEGYATASLDGQPVAGLVYRPRPAGREARPLWVCHASVPDLAVATQAVRAAGGQVHIPSQQVPSVGERAIVADGEGALFGLLTLSEADPEDYLAEPGEWIWWQLSSVDLQKAEAFYAAVGGYSVEEDGKTKRGSRRYLLVRDGYARAALQQLSSQRLQEGFRPAWLPFVRVGSVTESLARVPALGGKVVVPARRGLHNSQMAVVEDPSGGLMGIMEWNAVSESQAP